MPANLNKPFDPSCCDGGACGESLSAQPCGCDPGASWICAVHSERASAQPNFPTYPQQEADTLQEPPTFKSFTRPEGKMERHLDEVVNKTWNFSGRLTTARDHQMNAVAGLAAEAGECLDVCKKWWFHTPKDRSDELKSELGDVAYYFMKCLDEFGFTLDEVLADNKAKLESRHPELGKVSVRFGSEARK